MYRFGGKSCGGVALKLRRIVLIPALLAIMVLMAPQMALAGSGQKSGNYDNAGQWQSLFGSTASAYPVTGELRVWSHGWALQTGGGAWVGARANDISGSHSFKISASLTLYAWVCAQAGISSALIEVWFEIRDAENLGNILWMAKVWSYGVMNNDYHLFSGAIAESNPWSLSVDSPSNDYLFCVEFRGYTSFSGIVCHDGNHPDDSAQLFVGTIAWQW
jgi:hypothetical protein